MRNLKNVVAFGHNKLWLCLDAKSVPPSLSQRTSTAAAAAGYWEGQVLYLLLLLMMMIIPV